MIFILSHPSGNPLVPLTCSLASTLHALNQQKRMSLAWVTYEHSLHIIEFEVIHFKVAYQTTAYFR